MRHGLTAFVNGMPDEEGSRLHITADSEAFNVSDAEALLRALTVLVEEMREVEHQRTA